VLTMDRSGEAPAACLSRSDPACRADDPGKRAGSGRELAAVLEGVRKAPCGMTGAAVGEGSPGQQGQGPPRIRPRGGRAWGGDGVRWAVVGVAGSEARRGGTGAQGSGAWVAGGSGGLVSRVGGQAIEASHCVAGRAAGGGVRSGGWAEEIQGGRGLPAMEGVRKATRTPGDQGP
jgi:hypothetical protein